MSPNTFDRLKRSFPDSDKREIYSGTVTYGHDKLLQQSILKQNHFTYLVHKRKCFAFENEFRLIHWPLEDCFQGTTVSVDIDTLIAEIYTSPTSDPSFTKLVEAVVRRYGIDKTVTRSGLFDEPSE